MWSRSREKPSSHSTWEGHRSASMQDPDPLGKTPIYPAMQPPAIIGIFLKCVHIPPAHGPAIAPTTCKSISPNWPGHSGLAYHPPALLSSFKFQHFPPGLRPRSPQTHHYLSLGVTASSFPTQVPLKPRQKLPHPSTPVWSVLWSCISISCLPTQNLRVRSSGGTEFFTRSATKFKGALAQKFMFVDGDRAICGSYR